MKERKHWHQGWIASACISGMCALGLYGLFLYVRTIPRPPVYRVTIDLPQGAELYPEEVVRPGTFNIVISPAQLFALAAATPKHAIATICHDSYDRNSAVASYWLPKENGIFYFAQKRYALQPNLGQWYFSVERQGKMFVSTPLFFLFDKASFVIFISCFAGIAVCSALSALPERLL